MTRLAALLLALAGTLPAASTAAWELNTFSDFAAGKLNGLSLSRDGKLTLAPRTDVLYETGQPVIWSTVRAPDGSLYAGTGHRGRVFRVDAQGKGTAVWSAPEPEVFALAAGPNGVIYAGTSPQGKVYRIENGKAAEYFNPGAQYIWSMAVAPDGSLYVGTGDSGRIFRVTGPGKGEVWYETGQQHITSLAVDREGRLLAGSEPNGILYRITGKQQAFVLYDANLPEIRAIAVDGAGSIYAAAMGGTVARTTAAAASASQNNGAGAVSAPAISITVTDSSAQSGIEIKPPEAPKSPGTTPVTPGATVYTAPAATNIPGVEKSAVYRINADNTVDTLWTSQEENAYDVLPEPNGVLISTDTEGRVYRVAPNRHLTLLQQTGDGEATRLLPWNQGFVAARGGTGQLLRLGGAPAVSGTYESPVHDAGSVARWGEVQWRGAGVAFRTRTGNSARPDDTWSPWSAPVTGQTGSRVSSPNARYIQFQAELKNGSGAPPSLSGVTVSYLPQNNAPSMHSVNVVTQVVQAGAAKAAAAQPPAMTSYSITVTDTGSAASAPSAGTPAQTVSRGLQQQIHISWQADDPDGDRLSYSVWFRGVDEREWKRLRKDIAENILTLDGDVFADGRYLFRVVASDGPSNAPGSDRESELISPPVVFDATPPTLQLRARHAGDAVEIEAEARDAASGLRRAEYSVDASPWTPVSPEDGVIDGLNERFRMRIPGVGAGEHVIVMRVFDASGNSGVAKAVVGQ